MKNILKKLSYRVRYLLTNNTFPINKTAERKFVFIHINKTGGTSIAKALNIPKKRHYYVKDIIALVGERQLRNALVFTVVRNPWDRVVSIYEFRIKINRCGMGDGHISFKDWVKQVWKEKNLKYYDSPERFSPQLDWLRDKRGALRVDKILRFEALEQGFQQISELLTPAGGGYGTTPPKCNK